MSDSYGSYGPILMTVTVTKTVIPACTSTTWTSTTSCTKTGVTHYPSWKPHWFPSWKSSSSYSKTNATPTSSSSSDSQSDTMLAPTWHTVTPTKSRLYHATSSPSTSSAAYYTSKYEAQSHGSQMSSPAMYATSSSSRTRSGYVTPSSATHVSSSLTNPFTYDAKFSATPTYPHKYGNTTASHKYDYPTPQPTVGSIASGAMHVGASLALVGVAVAMMML